MSDEAFIHIVRTDIDPEDSSSLSTAARKLLSIGIGKPSVVEVSGIQMNWLKKLSDAGVAGAARRSRYTLFRRPLTSVRPDTWR